MENCYKRTAEIYIEVQGRKTRSKCNIQFSSIGTFPFHESCFPFNTKYYSFNFESCYTISSLLPFYLIKQKYSQILWYWKEELIFSRVEDRIGIAAPFGQIYV